MNKDTLCAAFPTQSTDHTIGWDGMSLRDYFAAKAMQAMLANHGNQNYDSCAQQAYMMADAMIEEREK
jgi:hypothetical protein